MQLSYCVALALVLQALLIQHFFLQLGSTKAVNPPLIFISLNKSNFFIIKNFKLILLPSFWHQDFSYLISFTKDLLKISQILYRIATLFFFFL